MRVARFFSKKGDATSNIDTETGKVCFQTEITFWHPLALVIVRGQPPRKASKTKFRGGAAPAKFCPCGGQTPMFQRSCRTLVATTHFSKRLPYRVAPRCLVFSSPGLRDCTFSRGGLSQCACMNIVSNVSRWCYIVFAGVQLVWIKGAEVSSFC